MGLIKYLVAQHADETDHHIRKAKECAKAANSHDVMAKSVSVGADVKQHHEEMRDCYKAQASEHIRMSELHIRKSRECGTMDFEGDAHGPAKVMKIASDVDRFRRDDTSEVSGIAPADPTRVRLAPRFGVDAAEIERANTEGNLAKLPAFERRDVTS
jgi:hypothetical protein